MSLIDTCAGNISVMLPDYALPNEALRPADRCVLAKPRSFFTTSALWNGKGTILPCIRKGVGQEMMALRHVAPY